MNTKVLDSMSVDVAVVSHTTVTIAIVGRLDAGRCPEVRDELDRRIADGCNDLIVDLSAATFIDSVGLAALVKGMRDSQKAGGSFALIRPRSDDAMRVFRLSKFDTVFEMRSPD